jgi:hypothetical protein
MTNNTTSMGATTESPKRAPEAIEYHSVQETIPLIVSTDELVAASLERCPFVEGAAAEEL